MANTTAPKNARVIWQDRLAQLTLGLTIVLNMALFILVFLTYDQLTEAIAGSVASDDRFGLPSSALILPVIGLVSWLLAGALGFFYHARRDQASIAYTVWGAAGLIQLAVWVPVLRLIISM
jgi:hypothetical protein